VGGSVLDGPRLGSLKTTVGGGKVGAMMGSTPAAPGRIFLSYRRDEADYPAGWLYEHLVERFGRDQVFKDVDSIELGDDFAEVIGNAVGTCDVLLALIGRQWLTITDEAGNRRLDDPNDFVRLEIEAALKRKVRVIPILVGNARMPRAEQMPTSLARLVRRQALELSPNRFQSDTGRLLRAVDKTLAQAQAQREAKAAREAEAKAKQEADAKATSEGPGGVSDTAEPAQRAAEYRLPAEVDRGAHLLDSAGSGNNLGSRRGEVGQQPEPRAGAPPATEKAPGANTTAVPKEPARREYASRDGTPSTLPRAVDTPAGPPPPSKGGEPPGKRRRRLSARARILAGVVVGVVLMLLLIFAIVPKYRTTPPPFGAVIPTGRVIFSDDFSRRASVWDDAGSEPAGGHYTNRAYRIRGEPVAAGGGAKQGLPRGASRVYPSAPRSLRIDVEARGLAGGHGTGHGIFCRADQAFRTATMHSSYGTYVSRSRMSRSASISTSLLGIASW